MQMRARIARCTAHTHLPVNVVVVNVVQIEVEHVIYAAVVPVLITCERPALVRQQMARIPHCRKLSDLPSTCASKASSSPAGADSATLSSSKHTPS